MEVLDNDKTVWFDCDDTLIKWGHATGPGWEEFWWNDQRYYKYVPHIEQLLEHKKRGHAVIVWSAGGVCWAEEVVLMLGLANSVDLVLPKPAWVYDDLPPNEYMPKSKFIKPDGSEDR